MTAETSPFATYGAELERLLFLRTRPIAVKMLENEADTPEGATRPKRDHGEHYAACQVFSLARRQGRTIAMFLEDHWCYAPIISWGLVEPPADYLEGFTHSFFIADKEAAAKHARESALLTGEPAVTVPDPGDFERAGATDDEMVLTVPASRLEELMTGVYHFEELGMGFRKFAVEMQPDFKQPPFYEEYFRRWGLDGPANECATTPGA